MGKLIENSTDPYVVMISLQFGYVGMDIISKVSLNRGMSHFVLVVYKHVVALQLVLLLLLFSLKRIPTCYHIFLHSMSLQFQMK